MGDMSNCEMGRPRITELKIEFGFSKGKFLEYFLTINVLWEGMVLFVGWGCVYGIYAQQKLMSDLFAKVESLRELLWRGTTWEYFTRSEALFEVASTTSFQLGYIRFLM